MILPTATVTNTRDPQTWRVLTKTQINSRPTDKLHFRQQLSI
jgi:hypothetical protein